MDWQIPCDIIGCDGKKCKEHEKKERLRNRFTIGQTVATSDGTGVVIAKDFPSTRPWRVRLDEGEEEMW